MRVIYLADLIVACPCILVATLVLAGFVEAFAERHFGKPSPIIGAMIFGALFILWAWKQAGEWVE